MLRTALVYGVIAGLIVAVPLFTMVLTGFSPSGAWGMVIGYLIMLIALSAVFVAIKRRRDLELGGIIRFWPAFGLGLAISVVAGVIYALGWEAALAVTGSDYGAGYAQAVIQAEKAKGLSGEALAQLSAEMQAFATQYADPLYRIPMTFTEIFPVGVLVSLVSAGLLCRRTFLPLRRTRQTMPA